MFQIGRHCMEAGEYRSGYFFLGAAARMPVPADDILFIDHALYDHRALMEYARCAHRVGDQDEAMRVSDELLARPGLAPELQDEIETTRKDARVHRMANAPLLASLISDVLFEQLSLSVSHPATLLSTHRFLRTPTGRSRY